MDLEKLDGLEVYILESLRPEDKRTGEDLRDNLRQIWYDQRLYDFDCLYSTEESRNNPEVYRRWIAKQQGKIKEKYKSLFCFEDLKPFYKEVYDRWHQKNDKSSK